MSMRVELRTMGSSSNSDTIPRHRIKYICMNSKKLNQFIIITDDDIILRFIEHRIAIDTDVSIRKYCCYCDHFTMEEFENEFIGKNPEDTDIYSPIIEDSFITYNEYKEDGVIAIYSYFGKSFDMSGKLIEPFYGLIDPRYNQDISDKIVNLNMSLLYSSTTWNHETSSTSIYPTRYCVVLDDVVNFKETSAVASPSTRANSILFIALKNIEKYYTSNSMVYFKHVFSYDIYTDNSIFNTTAETVKFLRKCQRICPEQRFRIARVYVNALGVLIVV